MRVVRLKYVFVEVPRLGVLQSLRALRQVVDANTGLEQYAHYSINGADCSLRVSFAYVSGGVGDVCCYGGRRGGVRATASSSNILRPTFGEQVGARVASIMA